MEVVINDCFGGFGLSTEAMKLLIKRKGKGVKVYKAEDYGLSSADIEKLIDAGDGYKVGLIEDVLYKDGYAYTYEGRVDEVRCDDALVRVVKEIGERANGKYAKLKVVNIPDDIQFTIEEYDGNEHVAEVHRTWC